MKHRCKDYWEDIVDLAEGKESKAAVDHLSQCPSCKQDFELLRNTVQGLAVVEYSAPKSVIEDARRIMPARQWKTVRRLGTLPQLATARGAAEFQAVYQEDNARIRVRYEREGQEWMVTGRVQAEEPTSAYREDQVLELDETGGFLFTAKTLEDTGFQVISGGRWLRVPSASEAVDDESGSSA